MGIIDFTGIFDFEGSFISFSGFDGLCDALIELSEKSRRVGLLSLEDDLDSLDNSLMKLLLQLVVDGTDPELVRETGERRISGILHYLGEIFSCVEFALLNRNVPDYEKQFTHYLKSRDTGIYCDLVQQIKTGVDGITSLPDIQGRYCDIIAAVISDLPDDCKFLVVENHFDSILRINRVYNEIILAGVLGIQSGFNPRILKQILFSYTALSFKEEQED